jgi:hypothetical protein
MRNRPCALFPNSWSYQHHIISPELVCLTIPITCILFAAGRAPYTATLHQHNIPIFWQPMRHNCIHRWTGARDLLLKCFSLHTTVLLLLFLCDTASLLSFPCVCVPGRLFCVHYTSQCLLYQIISRPIKSPYSKEADLLPSHRHLPFSLVLPKSNRMSPACGKTECAR